MLMLAVSAVCSAETIDMADIDKVKADIQGANPAANIVYMLFALNIAILIIYTMYGYVRQNDKELMNAKNEFGQLLVSLAVMILSYVLFITVNGLFLSQFHAAVAGTSSYTSMVSYNSHTFDTFRSGAEATMETTYDKIVEYRANAAVPTTLPMLFTSPVSVIACTLMSTPYVPLAIFGPGAAVDSFIKCGTSIQSLTIRTDAYQNTYADVLDMEVNSLMSPLFNLMVFMILLGKFFIDDALIYMFFGGIILRMSPWTRKAGDLIILVSLVAYIIYPFLYAVFMGAAQSVDAHGVDIVGQICSGLGSDANFPPFGDCSGPTGIMTLGKYAVLSSFVSSVILGLSLSILNNFRKVFEMIE